MGFGKFIGVRRARIGASKRETISFLVACRVAARVLTRGSKRLRLRTAASCILAFEPLWYKTERLRDPSRLGSELIAQTVV